MFFLYHSPTSNVHENNPYINPAYNIHFAGLSTMPQQTNPEPYEVPSSNKSLSVDDKLKLEHEDHATSDTQNHDYEDMSEEDECVYEEIGSLEEETYEVT